MLVLTLEARAAALVLEHGPPRAWEIATTAAIDAHLANDVAVRDYWRDIQAVLLRTAPRPGPGDLDIYRTAKMMILQHGAQEAWRATMKKAAGQECDLIQQAISLRVADAIKALSPGGPEERRTEF